MNNKIKTHISTTTDGSGLWTRHKTTITVKELQVHRLLRHEDKITGELRAVFPVKEWDTSKHGLIYTDRGWLKDFRNKLVELHGFSRKAANAVSYSEQGMQGDNYVSLDVGNDFLKEFAVFKTFGEIEEY